jgi:hypothetical protein
MGTAVAETHSEGQPVPTAAIAIFVMRVVDEAGETTQNDDMRNICSASMTTVTTSLGGSSPGRMR